MIDLKVPNALLLSQELTTSAKLVWMLCRLRARTPPSPVSRLVAESGLSPPTVRAALAQSAPMPAPSGPQAVLPAPLLTDPKVIPSAKVLYGLLQSLDGQFTYPLLSQFTGASPHTLKRAVAALVQAEWLQVAQHNRRAPIRFLLRNPILARQQSEVEHARRRIHIQQNKGEAIMKEFLSLIVDSSDFEDNARPGFLINPKTGERLELDRYYNDVAGFEYNGAPHFGTTDEALNQRTRDMVKVGVCAFRKIAVVMVHSEDLTLAGMRAKVEGLLPLRELSGHQLLIDYLERRAKRYRDSGGP